MKVTVNKAITYDVTDLTQAEYEAVISALLTVRNNSRNYTDKTVTNCTNIHRQLMETIIDG